MRHIRVLLLVCALVLALAGTATAATSHRLRPASHSGTAYVFGLGKVRADRDDVVSGRVLVGGTARRTLTRATLRRAIGRGSITLRVRKVRGRAVRLVVRVDERRPTRPRGLAASAGPGAVTLTWRPARDDVGVAAYRVTRDGKRVARLAGAARTWTDSGLQPGRSYRYVVRAVDRSGKLSTAAKAKATVSAAAGGGADPVVAPGPAGTSASGELMPASDLPGWRLRFADDFTQDVPEGSFPQAVAARWTAYRDRTDTSTHGWYAPDRVLSQHDGVLDWYMRTVGGQPLVAAALPNVPAQAYGRYAMRFRSDTLPGYKVAWLLWPTGTWPADGEIDFPEGDLDGTFCGFVHHAGATTGSDQDAFCGLGPFSAWHTAVVEWSPGLVRFLLDGQVVGSTTDRIPSNPMFWVLQSETSLGAAPSPGTSGHILLDWAVMWSRG